MTNSILIQELKKREQELIKELDAICALINVYEGDTNVKADTYVKAKRLQPKSTDGIDVRGNKNWKDYAYYILEKLGGEAKASDVIQKVIELNPSIDKKTIRNAIVSKLSQLYRDKTIDAIIPDSQKDGYIYKIKKESNDSK